MNEKFDQSGKLVAQEPPAVWRIIVAHWPFFVFAAIAIAARVVFWVYSDRVWEDALISLTPARNLWEGIGLTHHASEPRVHSFTSALGELILIVGESVRAGIIAMRLASLLAAVVAIYYAYKIGLRFTFRWSAHIVLLGYLATDHLQIFFGMAGMETQVATAVFLGAAYYLLSCQWTKLGVLLGLAQLARPEAAFLVLAAMFVLLLYHREQLLKVAAVTIAVAAPWFLFATLYFGSPIPHTIPAKQVVWNSSFFSAGAGAVATYTIETWRQMAPFLEFFFVEKVPVPETVLLLVVLALLTLSVIGAVDLLRQERKVLALLLALALFFGYRSAYTIFPYYMWYMPPFLALLFFIGSAGVNAIAVKSPRSGAAIGLALALAYVSPMPFTLALDRADQENDNSGRKATGEALNRLMGPEDTAELEPLGYIGWEARNRTIYDYPGLSSPIALAALRAAKVGGVIPWENGGRVAVIRELRPTFLVLRPEELADLELRDQDTAATYVEVYRTTGERVRLSRRGLTYQQHDSEFRILKLRAAAETEVAR